MRYSIFFVTILILIFSVVNLFAQESVNESVQVNDSTFYFSVTIGLGGYNDSYRMNNLALALELQRNHLSLKSLIMGEAKFEFDLLGKGSHKPLPVRGYICLLYNIFSTNKWYYTSIASGVAYTVIGHEDGKRYNTIGFPIEAKFLLRASKTIGLTGMLF